VRTLQRHLATCSVSYSRLLDQARIETAEAMLKDTDQDISCIARAVGYHNAPHFTRALHPYLPGFCRTPIWREMVSIPCSAFYPP
jgi:transcriptional regulator GlxA family with amidase domain